MDTVEQNPVQEDDFALEALEPSPIQEEYAPVIFAQETIKHVISVDVLSGKVTFFSILYTYVCSTKFGSYNLYMSLIFKPFIVIYENY